MDGLRISSQAPEWALPFVQITSETRISPDEARRYALELLEQALIAEIDAFLIQEGSDRLPVGPRTMVQQLSAMRQGQPRLNARSEAQVKFCDENGSHACSVQEAFALAFSILRAAVLAEQEALLIVYASDYLNLTTADIGAVLAELDAYRRTLPGSRVPEISTKQPEGARIHLGARFRRIVKSTLQSLRLKV